VEEIVLFLAGRADAADRTANEDRDSQRDEHSGKVAADGRKMCQKFMHIERTHIANTNY